MSNMSQPLVSVVIPVYNAARFLKQAIDSVLVQTYRNIELILVDDCSTDDSMQIMRAYSNKDVRIRLFSNQTNQGVAKTRNTGIQAANGEYIALLDSDDVWEKTKLESQIQLLMHEDADIAYCSLDFIDENGNVIKKPFIVPCDTNYNKMLVKCVFTCSTILAKAGLLKEHPFKSEYYHEDFLLWMELMKLPIRVRGDQTILMHNRQMIGTRSSNKIKAAKNRWKIYREALGLGLLESCIAFIKYAIYGVMKYYVPMSKKTR